MRYSLLFLYIGLLFVVFFALPDKVLYSQNVSRWIPFVLVFVVQPFLLYRLLKSFDVMPEYILGFCALSVLIIGPSLGFYLGYKDEKEFQKNGEAAKGIVYKKWYSSGKNKNSEWLLRCQYAVDGITYSTFSETDKANKYKVGDTLTVIFSKNFPQKCKIKELD